MQEKIENLTRRLSFLSKYGHSVLELLQIKEKTKYDESIE